MPTFHHAAVCTTDVEGSLRFWRDGLGFSVSMDESFEGDWPTLFGAPTDRLRSIFLGAPDGKGGVVELVDFGPVAEGAAPPPAPSTGFLLLSIYTDVDATLRRLADLGFGGDPRRTTVSGVAMAVVNDPNGVAVELIDLPL